jgi:hypothetical protein
MLVGKNTFLLSKKLDQVGGRRMVSVTWSYQAQILEKKLKMAADEQGIR